MSRRIITARGRSGAGTKGILKTPRTSFPGRVSGTNKQAPDPWEAVGTVQADRCVQRPP